MEDTRVHALKTVSMVPLVCYFKGKENKLFRDHNIAKILSLASIFANEAFGNILHA